MRAVLLQHWKKWPRHCARRVWRRKSYGWACNLWQAASVAAVAPKKRNVSAKTLLDKAAEADGFVFGSPVHYAAASGTITSFLDRAFYAGNRRGVFAGKPGAVVVSCRRGGASAAFDQLNKYLTISSMPVVSSQYWNQVHGNTPDEVRQDLEGMQTMRTLGRNMAWLLRCIEAGRRAGIDFPQAEPGVRTNFIR